jgi:hypothetical protein
MNKVFIALLALQMYQTAAFAQGAKWQTLFNGKDLNGWVPKMYHHETGDNYQNTFRAEDGLVKVRYDGYQTFGDRFGHLFYQKPFSYFHLVMEYRFTGRWMPDAPIYTVLNSGVMYHSQDPYSIKKEQNWPISIEMQYYVDLPNDKPRTTGNMCSPGTEIDFEGKQYAGHCLNSTSSNYQKEQWVKVELIVLGDSLVTHIVEGKKVLQYSKPRIGGGVADGFDAEQFKAGTPLTSGYIGLQSEGQEIEFRNIKILDLEPMRREKPKKYDKYLRKMVKMGKL